MKRFIGFLIAMLACGAAFAKQPDALFYLMGTPKSLNSFVAHVDKIGLLVPTWYGVDDQGLVNGGPNPYVMDIAKEHRLPVMPIISMTAGRKGFHDLLHDETAKRHMIDAAASTGTWLRRVSVRLRKHFLDGSRRLQFVGQADCRGVA
jgi:spore germination protein YaaH